MLDFQTIRFHTKKNALVFSLYSLLCSCQFNVSACFIFHAGLSHCGFVKPNHSFHVDFSIEERKSWLLRSTHILLR